VRASDLHFDKGAIGAELRYGSDGESDGDVLAVVVGPGLPMSQFACDSADAQDLAGCDEMDGGSLLWQDHEPEEDPGFIYAVTSKGDTTVVVYQAGPTVKGDPRDMDMPISVEDMFAIANDPRLHLTTSQEALDAGVDFWRDGP
jgi:hypothetical protein